MRLYGVPRKPSTLIDDRSELSAPARPSTPIFQSGYLKKTTSKLFRIRSKEQTTTSQQLYEEPASTTVRRTHSNSSWALKSNQLLNRLRKKQSSTESLAAPSETSTTTAKAGGGRGGGLQPVKLRFKTKPPPTSKSLSNINLTWLQAQQREPASFGSPPTAARTHHARSNTIHSLPRVHSLTSTTPSTAPSAGRDDGREGMMHARSRVQHSRQTIYMPLEYRPSLSRPTFLGAGQPAGMRHKRHSPTEIALSQLDEILRGGVSSSSSSSSKTIQPLQPPAIACSTMPIMPELYTLSPPHRPSRSKPALLDPRHHRRNSSDLAKTNNNTSFPPPVAPTKPHKVPLQPHAWQAISISAASYHRLHQHPPPPSSPLPAPQNLHHIGTHHPHHLDNFELVSPDRPPFVPSSDSPSPSSSPSPASSGVDEDHSSIVSVSSSSDHSRASPDHHKHIHCS